ncbi:hypothetical protein C8024_00195 [Sphingopyxis sp. BSNA05]|uniref:hypothetical protein n=1 Tax=Sphingopyxis sp. BSNA05 TaxID=1236614 RepID=UPI001565050D|nr:hypothetical protein [Sphingopyxis sp. BSNA05]NRD88208.1 hypothetical protein [Sphingopyxis sp. BSNA05]
MLTLMAEGKDRQALEVAERIIPSSTGVGPYYDIAMAMVYAKTVGSRIRGNRGTGWLPPMATQVTKAKSNCSSA